jgi:hypothetical protein
MCNKGLANTWAQWAGLLGAVNPDVQLIGIGHSNGCALLYRAVKVGAPFDKLIFLNPALDRGKKFPEQVKQIHVFYTPHDKPTRISRWLLWHPWGNMGQKGSSSDDLRIINWDMSVGFIKGSEVKSHGGVFKKLEYYGPVIADIAKD